MADPIPRNSRADETAEYRRAAQECRGNRPLFGEGFGGGLRARVENPPNEPHRPRAAPENPFGRPAQARPNPPPAEQNAFIAQVERAVRRVVEDRAPRPPQARRVAPRSTTRSAIVAVGLFALFMAVIGARSIVGTATIAAPDIELSGPLVASAPMIPVDVPAEICSVELSDLKIHVDVATQYAEHALAADLRVAMHGCDRQLFRYAIWVFQAENAPLLAPDADDVFRSPIGQLTAQSLSLVDAGATSASLAIGIPHHQFPTAVGLPIWLTVGVQVWPEGRPASGGSLKLQQVFFTRAE